MTEYNKKYIYAVYKGDKYICEGTREEICKKLNIKKATFQFYRSNWYKKNRKTRYGDDRRTIIIRVDGEDKIWNE